MMRYSIFLNSLMFIMILFFSNITFAKNLKPTQFWEFSGKYQPYWETLWHFDGQFFELSCEDKNDVMYENYAKLHPQFRPLMANKDMRKKWRQSLIVNGNGGIEPFNSCFYEELIERWIEATYPGNKKTIVYCGKVAEGLNAIDHDGASAIAELGEYAIIGRSYPVVVLVRTTLKDERVRLNDDIQYYLQLHLRSFLAAKPPISAGLAQTYETLIDPDAGEKLSPEKRKFLDEAFKRGDHRSVLEATAPCQSA